MSTSLYVLSHILKENNPKITPFALTLFQSLLFDSHLQISHGHSGLTNRGGIYTVGKPRWIWRSSGVRLSFLRAEASSFMSINTTMGCTLQRGRARSLDQENLVDLCDENEDLCPVECVTEFKTDDELFKVLEKAKDTNSLVVVDFYRTSCGSCKYIEQGFSKLCKQSGDQEAPVIFLKHNVMDEYEEQSEVAERLRIKSVPLFHFYKNGVLLEAFATRDKERIDAAILKYTSSSTFE
ncbi:Thioredoxin-like 4 [Cardamine amara subsp. amara]|uniref:Thioredoxin-like 4, chloroplastic n=1 Tax=Cardamine amara subsp. amara TaxID=228776 RepID=A0ABD1A782_CARAN